MDCLAVSVVLITLTIGGLSSHVGGSYNFSGNVDFKIH